VKSPRRTAGGETAWDLSASERQLLLACLLCVSLGFVMVLGADLAVGRDIGLLDLLPLLAHALSLLALHLTLVSSGFRGDQVLPTVVALLSGIGLLAQYRMGAFESPDPWATSRFIFPAGVAVMLAI